MVCSVKLMQIPGMQFWFRQLALISCGESTVPTCRSSNRLPLTEWPLGHHPQRWGIQGRWKSWSTWDNSCMIWVRKWTVKSNTLTINYYGLSLSQSLFKSLNILRLRVRSMGIKWSLQSPPKVQISLLISGGKMERSLQPRTIQTALELTHLHLKSAHLYQSMRGATSVLSAM